MYLLNKTSATIVFLCLLFTIQALGQDIYVSGGLNFSQLKQQKQNTYSDKQYRPGFHIGSAIDIKLNDHFDFVPGLLFSLKRQYHETRLNIPAEFFPSDNTLDPYVVYQFNTSLNEYYLDLPINIKYSFSINKQNLYVLVGPYFNLLLFDDSDTEFFINGESDEPQDAFKEKFGNRIDYGVNAGVGFEMNSYLLQTSYDYGFFRTMEYQDVESEESFRNSIFRLTFGYKF